MGDARIGQRVEPAGLTMELLGPPPRRLLWRIGKPVTHVVDVIDLSVTGALVRGRRWDGFDVGAVLHMRIDGHHGSARILRIDDDDRAGHVRYGLEIVGVDPKLWEDFSNIVGHELHPEGDPTWHERHDE